MAPGRNTAILVEVAARNQLLKERGYDAAQRFTERVEEMIDADAGAQAPLVARAARRRAHARRPAPPCGRAAAGSGGR